MDSNLPGSSVHGIPRQEYWSGEPFPSPGDLPNPGIVAGSPALQVDSLLSEPPGKPYGSAQFSLHLREVIRLLTSCAQHTVGATFYWKAIPLSLPSLCA